MREQVRTEEREKYATDIPVLCRIVREFRQNRSREGHGGSNTLRDVEELTAVCRTVHQLRHSVCRFRRTRGMIPTRDICRVKKHLALKGLNIYRHIQQLEDH